MKAIETEYRGYRFRSRLEARWAVYLDTLGMDWSYEPEGFEFRDGRRYLPDFFVKDCPIWIEVKGQLPTKAEIQLCADLADQSGTAVLLVNGLPGEKVERLFCWDMTDGSAGSYQGIGQMKFPASSFAEFYSDDDTRLDRDREIFFESGFSGREFVGQYRPFGILPNPHQFAIDAAKSARFEHGESGARK